MSPAAWKPPAFAVTTPPCRLSPREQNAIPAVPPPRRSHTPCSCSSALPGWLPISSGRPAPPEPPQAAGAPLMPGAGAEPPLAVPGSGSPGGERQTARSELLAAEPRCGPRRGGCGAASSLSQPRSRPGWAAASGAAPGDTQRPPRELQLWPGRGLREGAALQHGLDAPAPPGAEPPCPGTAEANSREPVPGGTPR